MYSGISKTILIGNIECACVSNRFILVFMIWKDCIVLSDLILRHSRRERLSTNLGSEFARTAADHGFRGMLSDALSEIRDRLLEPLAQGNHGRPV
jgi:hypothetical protein